jgi:hypothetical protein
VLRAPRATHPFVFLIAVEHRRDEAPYRSAVIVGHELPTIDIECRCAKQVRDRVRDRKSIRLGHSRLATFDV